MKEKPGQIWNFISLLTSHNVSGCSYIISLSLFAISMTCVSECSFFEKEAAHALNGSTSTRAAVFMS